MSCSAWHSAAAAIMSSLTFSICVHSDLRERVLARDGAAQEADTYVCKHIRDGGHTAAVLVVLRLPLGWRVARHGANCILARVGLGTKSTSIVDPM